MTNDGKFKKGMIPWNKGKKISADVYEKASPTMFKKGNIPPNAKYNGAPYFTTRVRKNGYKERRWMINVNGKRMSYLVYLCEKNGINLVNKKPRLKPNFNIENEPTINDILVLTNAENMELNSVQRYPKELRRLIQIYGVFNNQLKKRK